MSALPKDLIDKLTGLPADDLSQVQTLIDVRWRSCDTAMTRAAQTASSPAFEAVWSNPEDDVYDSV